MATLAELESALVAADNAGNVEDARALANEILRQRGAGSGASAWSRFGTGLADPVHGGAQLLTEILPSSVVNAGNRLNNWLADKTGLVTPLPPGGVSEAVRQREAAYQAPEGMDWARLAGNVFSPVNLALSATGAAAPATLGGRMLSGAAMGATSAALTPATGNDFAAEKARQVAVGAFGGAAVPALTAGIGRVISPAASTNPNVALLRSEGVQPTIGQTLGGWPNRVEEKAASLPIVGDAITWARRRAQEQLNTAALNRVGDPIGARFTGAGHDAIAAAHDAASAAYEAAKQRLGNFQLDAQAVAELANLDQLAGSLPAKEAGVYQSMRSYLTSELTPNGSLLAQGFKRFDSKVTNAAQKLSGSSDAYQRWAGDALKELQRIVIDAGKRADPQAGAMFDAADAAWANLVRVENAAGRAANAGGVFTPGQLNMAIRATDRSARKSATARGEALMQDLASAGQTVLGNRVPDSGTAGRLALGLGGLGAEFLSPGIPAALTAGALAYTPPIQGLLRGAVTSRPQLAQPIAGFLNQASPMLSPAGGLFGLEMLQQ